MGNQCNMQKYDNTLQNCNFAKTILMVIIIFYHSILFWRGSWFDIIQPTEGSSLLKYTAIWLNTFHVHTFTLISGYIYYNVRYEKQKYNDMKKFIINKIKRLLVPYVFVAAVWVIPISQYFFHYPMKEIIAKYVLGTNPSQLWFLLMLFNVFMFFHILSDLLRENSLKSIFLICFLFCISAIGALFLPNIFQLLTALRYMLFFYIGFKMRQLDLIRFIGNKLMVALSGAEIMLFIIYIHYSDTIFGKILQFGAETLLNILGSVLCFVLLQTLSNKIHWQEKKIITYLSEISMPMYLFHQQIIYIMLMLFNGINPYIHVLINFSFAIVFSLILSTILMRFRITRFLIGEK